MYTEFYRLTAKPFQLSPNPKYFFGSTGHQKALAYLRYGLHQGEGFIVITGDIGTGKTTLLGHLLHQLDPAQYLAAKLVTTQLEPDDMLRMVVAAFGIDARHDKADLLRQFEHFVLENQRHGKHVLLLVDEVQNLPTKSLEELRMLSNFQANDVSPIQFCLLGQPQFRSILESEDLTQLRQRVIVSYHLGPLSREETKEYIEHRLKLVSWSNDPKISQDAYARIHSYTGGVPRRINVMCDRLLLCGMLEDLHEIALSTVEAVAAEMAQENRVSSPKEPPREPAVAIKQENIGTFEDIGQRLDAAERMLRAHDVALRRGLQLAESYLRVRSGGSVSDTDTLATSSESP